MVPPWAPAAVVDSLFDPRAVLGDAPIGAVVSCPDRLSLYPGREGGIARMVAGRATLATPDGCALLAGGPSPATAPLERRAAAF